MRIECLGVAKIIYQLSELTRHLIRIGGRIVLILLPLINIFLNKKAFSHLGRFSFIFTDKYSKLLLNMPLVKLDTGFNIEVEFAISPFHRRFFAYIIDAVIMIAYGILMSRLLVPVIRDKEGLEWVYLLASCPVAFYFLISEVTMNGQSVGKKVMAIKVITEDGGQPTISQYFIRWIFRMVDFPVWVMSTIYADALPWWCSI